MKRINATAILALILALVFLAADPASAAMSRRKKDAAANVSETTGSAQPAAVQPAAVQAAPPAQAATEQAAPAQAQPVPYPASSSALMVQSAKPSVETPIRQGKVEAGGALAYAWTGGMTDTMTLRGRVGLFYTRELSLGLSFTTNLDGRDNVNSFFIEPQYHFFVDPKLVPFVDAKIGGGLLGDGSDNHFTSFALGVGGGVKYFHEDDAFFYLQFDDIHYFGDGGIASLSLGLGLAKLF
ncbi:hypothetical protein EPN96_04180 [bacterium]|nr:MAG: hypothetical protein EPN96_04180 [bacterium]